jgi:DNA adenine methylase
MNPAIDAPRRPALRYYGGKWNLAPWIISRFPEHKTYVEPCGGAASVLLQKPRSPQETYNDLDGNVVNFFRVLRDRPDELIRKIKLTPWARAEYELSLTIDGDDVERARRFFVVSWMSIGQSLTCTPGQFRSCAQYYAIPMELQSDALDVVADRFRGVQIESMPYAYVIGRYDNADALIYFDPPYVTSTRTNGNVYLHEWTDSDHATAADLLRTCAGYVVVSGYACPLYADLYERHGWQRADIDATTNGGKRVESLWLSPRTVEALAVPAQAGLFA